MFKGGDLTNKIDTTDDSKFIHEFNIPGNYEVRVWASNEFECDLFHIEEICIESEK